jgi:hypothetical protein
MRKLLILGSMAGLLAGCATTPRYISDPSPNICTSNDRARLSGIRAGAKLGGGFDPSTSRGQEGIAELNYLTNKCEPTQTPTPATKPPPA